MKYLITILITMILSACQNGSEPRDLTGKTFIVTGQSNAITCDWSYFEKLTESTVINIAKSSLTIDQLISRYDHPIITGTTPDAIIFIHGEADGHYQTPPDYYTSQVEHLRLIISGHVDYELPLYISTVGYITGVSPLWFDKLRAAVKEYDNPWWIIAFDGAHLFGEQGKLKDNVHFNHLGCKDMMDAMVASIGNP